MNVVLIENRGKHLAFVNQTLLSMGIPATKENNNENVAVLQDLDTNKIIGVIGFSADSGTNYFKDIIQNHEILYMEAFTKLSTNTKYASEIKRLISLWLLNYLTRSAVSFSNPLGTPKGTDVFQVGINVQHDINNILRDSFDLISNTFYEVANSLGFHTPATKPVSPH